MDAYYKVNVSFPDGHVEEIEDIFPSLEAAQAYGNNILNQISSTEPYHNSKKDIFGEKTKFKPYFEVLVVVDNNSKIVFKSK